MDPATWAGRRVLVTGHTGFKGSWLSLWLAHVGAEVTGLSDGIPTSPSHFELARVDELVSDRRGDIRDITTVRDTVAAARPEVVFHLAAKPLVRASYESPVATYATNVIGTANVLEVVRAAPSVRAVVVVTSDKCYRNDERRVAYTEGDPLGGTDPYSSSKAAAELVTASFRSSYFGADSPVEVATARAGNVVGGGDWAADRLLPDALRAKAAGRALVVRHPDARRPWQDVADCLSGYVELAERLLTGPGFDEAWNFGPPPHDALAVREVLAIVDRLLPGGLEWTVDDGPKPHEAGYLSLDASKARDRLGWTAARDVTEAIAAAIQWHAAVERGGDPRAVSLDELVRHEKVER